MRRHGNERNNVGITYERTISEFRTRDVGVTQAKYDPLLWHTMLATAYIRWTGSSVELDLGDDTAGSGLRSY
jgi:hypothetical protein